MNNDDIVPLFQGDPSDPKPMALRQGVVQEWDPDTGENSVQVAGGTLVNIPALTGESMALAAGDVVALLTTGDSWLVIGKVTTPGDPGTVPSWSGDIEALAPLVPIAEMTTGTTITGVTQESSDTGPRVVINDPAYPGEIVLYTDDPDELEPARLKPIISGNIARLRFIGPKVTGMAGVPATFDLEANTTSAERQSALDVDRYHLFSTDTTIDGFTRIRLGDGTDYITIVGQTVTDADLSSATNTFPATSAWTNLPLVNSWVSAGGRTAQYCKDLTGRVQLRGRISSGTSGAAIATLPAGFRPTQDMEWTMRSAGGIIVCAVQVATTGVITAVGNATTVSSAGANIDTISFPTN